MRHLFVVDSLDKAKQIQMQNEKELIRLASAGVGGLFCVCVESIILTIIPCVAYTPALHTHSKLQRSLSLSEMVTCT